VFVWHNGAMTAITDVPGIRVGHASRTGEGWLSGVTVVLPPPGTVGSVDVRGGGPGTHETDALDPTTLTTAVDAVVLTGGRTTVTPLSQPSPVREAWPTRIPGTSVIAVMAPLCQTNTVAYCNQPEGERATKPGITKL
jgi:L-aminopeptidase/D-esterase-like protein